MRIRRRHRRHARLRRPACAQPTAPSCLHHFDAYFDAFAALNRSDIVAVALTLGVLLFAVVYRDHAGAHAAARGVSRGRVPRRDHGAQGRARPLQRAADVGAANSGVVGGGRQRAGHSRRHHAGHQRSDAAARAGVRLLARAGQGAGHGARRRCAARRRRRLRDAVDDARRPRHRGRRPRHRRPRGAAAARCQRPEARARRAQRPP